MPPAQPGSARWTWTSRRVGNGVEIGRYDTRAFRFKPVHTLPFSIDTLHYSRTEQRVYVVHEGHLLRLGAR